MTIAHSKTLTGLLLAFTLFFSNIVCASNHTYEIYLTGEVNSDMADAVIPVIQATGAGDVLRIHMNTPGGYVDYGKDIIAALKHTPAIKVMEVDGFIASMGVDILMSGDYVLISHFDGFVIHAAYDDFFFFHTHWTPGLAAEHQRQLKLYAPYLTKEEVSYIFKDWGDLYWSRQTLEQRIDLPNTPLQMLHADTQLITQDRRNEYVNVLNAG